MCTVSGRRSRRKHTEVPRETAVPKKIIVPEKQKQTEIERSEQLEKLRAEYRKSIFLV